MANALMMRYAASRGDRDEMRTESRMEMPMREPEHMAYDRGMAYSVYHAPAREIPAMPAIPPERMTYNRGMAYNEANEPGMTYSEYREPGMRHPNQYTARNEYDEMESRYRGKNGRWRSGTRRSEYEDGMMAKEPWAEPESRNRGYDRRRSMAEEPETEEEKEYKVKVAPSNVIDFPYVKPDPEEDRARYRRQIGFGAENNMWYGGMMPHDGYHMGRSEGGMGGMEFDRETAETWVRSMRNEDKAHPVGGKWSPEMLKPLAQKYGLPTDGKKFWELYAMTNAMYSDYGEVARKFGITSPEFYVCMAKAWMDDKDAEPDKTALYYEYIVKKE